MNDKVYRDIDNFKVAELKSPSPMQLMYMDYDAVTYLYLTLQTTMQQLHESNELLNEIPDKPFQHLVNGLLWNDLNEMSNKLEAVFPSLTELVEDTD